MRKLAITPADCYYSLALTPAMVVIYVMEN